MFTLASALVAVADPCALAPTPTPGPTVNVRDEGAKGDGQADDTAALQRAIDAVSAKGGTVMVPDGVYMLDAATPTARIKLKSRVTLKLAPGATLKAIPNAAPNYALLTIADATQVAIIGGTLEGDRNAHLAAGGEWGMGVWIAGAAHVTISGTTSKNMWGDGFYIDNASNVALCGVTADHNRRQGLSIISGHDIDVVGSTFSNTRGTEPSAGIDLEPDSPAQKITRVSIRRPNSSIMRARAS